MKVTIRNNSPVNLRQTSAEPQTNCNRLLVLMYSASNGVLFDISKALRNPR